MRVLVTGCSFSEKMRELSDEYQQWMPWSDLIHFDGYNVKNVAQSSFGQGKITQSVVQFMESNPKPDLVVIQLSAILRGYASNMKDFYLRITNQKESFFLLHDDEYITPDNEWEGKVSMADDELTEEVHWNTLCKVLMLKSYLKERNQDYIMFWGWNQLENAPDHIKSIWKSQVYDNNFWSYNEWGGMSEYIIDTIGSEMGILPMDFHPTSEGHRIFYDDIIKPKLKDYFGNKTTTKKGTTKSETR